MNKLDVIGFEPLYNSMLKCQRSVQWKSSVAHFTLNSVEEISKLSSQLINGTYKERPQKKFCIYRPKKREIISISFRDRVYQRSLNDNVIYPIFSKKLIYDNCSCQKGKGTTFALDRLKTHLHRYYNKHGSDGFVLQCDIKGYYPNMNHNVAKAIFKRYLDNDFYEMASRILDTFDGEIGFNPGSQIIQLAGITVLNELDHKIKEQFKIKHYIRYMDDFILVHHDREYLEQCRYNIDNYLKTIGFMLNDKKTKLYPLSDGIIFLGFQFKVTITGKVLCFVNPKKIKQDKREIRKLAKLVKEGKMTKDQYFNSYQCRRSHYSYGDSTKLLLRMDKYIKELIYE